MTNILPFVVHVRASGGWSRDLAGEAGGLGATGAEGYLGLLTLEVDGVDLTAGRAEGALVPALTGLLAGLARLRHGGLRAAAPLGDGALLLVMERQGDRVRLSLLEAGPPARPQVRAVEVDLQALAAAAAGEAAALAAVLAEDHPEGAAAARLLRTALRAGRSADRRGSRDAPVLEELSLLRDLDRRPGFDLAPDLDPALPHLTLTFDEAGAPLLVGPAEPADLASLLSWGQLTLLRGGAPPLELHGFPFLLLRDLVDGLEEASRARRRGEAGASLRLSSGLPAVPVIIALTWTLADEAPGRARPLAARPLAEATLAAAEALAQRAGQAATAHLTNPALLELLAGARAAVAHLTAHAEGDTFGTQPPTRRAAGPAPQPPLGPGELRRITMRPVQAAHVGLPVAPRLALSGPALLAFGEDAVVGHGRGATWRAPGGRWGAVAGRLALLCREERLVALDPASGRERWARALPGAEPTGATARPGGPVLLSEAEALTALDPATGATRWRVELPGSGGLAIGAAGSLGLLASASGQVHAYGPDGRLAWRIRAPGPALAPPLPCGRLVATLHDAGGGAVLQLRDAATGARHLEVTLDVRPAGAPLAVPGGLVVGGRSGGEVVLVRVDAARGRRWEVGLPLSGPPQLASAGHLLVVGDGSGALVALDAGGREAWSLPPSGGEGGAAGPETARGVVLAARGGLALLDAPSGRSVGLVEGLAPALLLAGPGLEVAALELDGAVTWLAPGGHLSLLPAPLR